MSQIEHAADPRHTPVLVDGLRTPFGRYAGALRDVQESFSRVTATLAESVNGVRVTVEDGTWGLVRASSNKPELVVVVESPVSEARMRDMFKALDAVLRTHPEVGEYNQTI